MPRFRSIMLAMVFGLGVVVCLPAAALAEDAAHKEPEGEKASHDGAAHKAAGEEKNILEPRFDLTIWTIVVFVLLLLILRKWAWGPMLEGLHSRDATIRQALEEAELARKETAELRAKVDAEIRKGQEEARAVVAQASRDAQRAGDEMLAKARTEIQAEGDRKRREIETARDQALKDLWERTAKLAAEISAKAVGRQLNEDDHRRLVDQALTEMRQVNAN